MIKDSFRTRSYSGRLLKINESAPFLAARFLGDSRNSANRLRMPFQTSTGVFLEASVVQRRINKFQPSLFFVATKVHYSSQSSSSIKSGDFLQ